MFEVLGKNNSVPGLNLLNCKHLLCFCFSIMIHACLFRNTQVKYKIIANVKQFLCLVLELFIIEVYLLFF